MSLFDRMRGLQAPNCVVLTVHDFYGVDLLSDSPLALHGPVYRAMLAAHKRDIDYLVDMTTIADALQSTAPRVE